MARSFSRTITTPAAARMVRPSARPVVSLLTDFGARDPSAGIMRAVVLGVAPEALVIDIGHEVEKYRVRDGALLLWCAVPYLPNGAHVAVVDPGVGTERRGIAIETTRGDFLVGPDNGILLPAASRLGGITRVHQLTSAQYRLPVISSSFHGRDVFAPAAAHLSLGLPIEFLGPALDPRQLVHLDWPEAQVFAGILRSQVIYLDTFGNVKLSALGPDLAAALGHVRYGERLWLRLTDQFGSNDVEVTWVETFARVAVGQPLLYEDSYGRLGLAINQGSAVVAIGVREDAEVLVTRIPLPRVEAEPPALPVPAVPEWTGAPAADGWADPAPGWGAADGGWQTGTPAPLEAGQAWVPTSDGVAPAAGDGWQPPVGQPGAPMPEAGASLEGWSAWPGNGSAGPVDDAWLAVEGVAPVGPPGSPGGVVAGEDPSPMPAASGRSGRRWRR